MPVTTSAAVRTGWRRMREILHRAAYGA
jgi:hypothetical protein